MDYSIWQAVVSALPAERFSSNVTLKAAIAREFAVVAASDVPDKAVLTETCLAHRRFYSKKHVFPGFCRECVQAPNDATRQRNSTK